MADADAATTEDTTKVRLQVAAARQEESGQGIARMPRSAFQQLGITEGDIIEIEGKRTTPARALLPTAPIVYAADSAGFPYGTKSEAEIAARVPALLGRLVERYRPRLAVIACNTASTIALAAVRAALDIPVVGTVPAIKPAALLSRSRVFGVLGTDATVRQPYVDRLAAEHGADCTVLRHGSAALVQLAEAKLRGEALDPQVARAALAGLTTQPGGDRMDMVVLACTHFPLLEGELRKAFGRDMRFVHGAEGIARRIAALTEGQAFERGVPDRAITTGELADFEKLEGAFARYGIDRLEKL